LATKPVVVFGADKLRARDSGPWAREKLSYLRRYLEMFTTGMSAKWPRLVFLDLMAGPGLCIDRTDKQEFSGSPLLALSTKKPFHGAYFVESDPELRAALERRIATHPRRGIAEVLDGDSNTSRVIAKLRSVTEDSLSIAFIDLIGQEISFETIRALTQNRNLDLWFSFPEMDLRRNVPVAPDDPDEADRWTRFFGTDQWRPIVTRARPGQAIIELRALYRQQLKGLGYESELSRLPMKNSRGRGLYRPLFASRHARGLDFFGKALQRDSTGTGLLFD